MALRLVSGTIASILAIVGLLVLVVVVHRYPAEPLSTGGALAMRPGAWVMAVLLLTLAVVGGVVASGRLNRRFAEVGVVLMLIVTALYAELLHTEFHLACVTEWGPITVNCAPFFPEASTERVAYPR